MRLPELQRTFGKRTRRTTFTPHHACRVALVCDLRRRSDGERYGESRETVQKEANNQLSLIWILACFSLGRRRYGAHTDTANSQFTKAKLILLDVQQKTHAKSPRRERQSCIRAFVTLKNHFCKRRNCSLNSGDCCHQCDAKIRWPISLQSSVAS